MFSAGARRSARAPLGGGATALPIDPLAGLRGPASKGRKIREKTGEGEEMEGKVGGQGKGRIETGGKGGNSPLTQISGSATAAPCLYNISPPSIPV